jgi:hypothetical protein
MAKRVRGMDMPENDAVLPPVRLDRALLDAARALAASRDETLSQVVRRQLRAYVASAPTLADVEAVVSAERSKAKRS